MTGINWSPVMICKTDEVAKLEALSGSDPLFLEPATEPMLKAAEKLMRQKRENKSPLPPSIGFMEMCTSLHFRYGKGNSLQIMEWVLPGDSIRKGLVRPTCPSI